MAEHNLDPASITGTGKDGRITKGDALAAAAAPAIATIAPKDTGPREERVKMTRLRQTIAKRLKDAQNTAAMLTTFNEVDMSGVMALRNQYKDAFEKRHGVKLGFMGFFVRACVTALKEIPAINAEIDGTDIVYKNHYDIGVAVGTDKVQFFPVGARGAFKVGWAPADEFKPFLGQRGREYVGMVLADPSGREAWDRVELYSYPLFIATRPEMLLRARGR